MIDGGKEASLPEFGHGGMGRNATKKAKMAKSYCTIRGYELLPCVL
jgi:hypothetical protein